jgi:hypothetical protein
VQQLGSAVLIQGIDALDALYRCLLKQVKAVSVSGHSPLLINVMKTQVARAIASERGHFVAGPFALQSQSKDQGVADLMSVAEAATELEVSSPSDEERDLQKALQYLRGAQDHADTPHMGAALLMSSDRIGLRRQVEWGRRS